MEAPKEIYILKTKASDGGFGSSYHNHPIETERTESIKYIRADKAVDKEALLEWAKDTYLRENASAIRKVCYKQLIEKIESI